MLVVFLLLFEPLLSSGVFFPAEPLEPFHWTHTNVLDADGSFHLFWIPGEEWVVFEIQAKTTGYVGLGFSPNGGMHGADIVMSWVKNGEIHLRDYHSVGNQLPEEDQHQDYELLGGYENETHTMVRFRRKWITCDKNDNDLLTDTTRVIWSLGSENADVVDNHSVYHAKRGTKSLYLNDPQFSEPNITPDTKIWEVRANNVTLPHTSDTLYYCRTFKAPQTDTKHHIIRFLPVLSPGNEEHVHHMILYRCRDDISQDVFNKFTERGYACYTVHRDEFGKCNTIYIGWAVGSKGTFLPEKVGFSLGSKFGGNDYFVLEVHYDNTALKKGVVDSSGLRMHYTDKLREYDADAFTVGHNFDPFQLVPPGQKNFITTGICGSVCTQKFFPEGGLHIFIGLLHSHLAGRKMTIRHIRNGQELSLIMKDNHYDFNYQETRSLNKEVTVLPGDDLIMECSYETTDRQSITTGGLATKDEMCAAFLVYYPRIDLTTCLSRPTVNTLFKAVGITGLYLRDMREEAQEKENDDTKGNAENSATSKTVAPDIAKYIRNIFLYTNIATGPEAYANKTLAEIFDGVDWSNKDVVDHYQRTLAYGPYQQTCGTQHETNIEKRRYRGTYPEFSPLKDEVISVCSAPQVKEVTEAEEIKISEADMGTADVETELTTSVQEDATAEDSGTLSDPQRNIFKTIKKQIYEHLFGPS